MTKYEKLINEAIRKGAKVIEIDLGTDKACGKCIDNILIINNRMNETEKHCILAEELAHYSLTVGDITNQIKIANRKQELVARKWAYEKLVGLVSLINAYEKGIKDKFELVEYINVTESFLDEAIHYYSSKYGTHYEINNYIIYFSPSFGILKII